MKTKDTVENYLSILMAILLIGISAIPAGAHLVLCICDETLIGFDIHECCDSHDETEHESDIGTAHSDITWCNNIIKDIELSSKRRKHSEIIKQSISPVSGVILIPEIYSNNPVIFKSFRDIQNYNKIEHILKIKTIVLLN